MTCHVCTFEIKKSQGSIYIGQGKRRHEPGCRPLTNRYRAFALSERYKGLTGRVRPRFREIIKQWVKKRDLNNLMAWKQKQKEKEVK